MTGQSVWLGRMAYRPCTDLQQQVLERVIAGELPNTLLLVEHDPVLTLGANFHQQNLLLSAEEYESKGIELARTERGGDVTLHGPGQLVMYPIFDVARFGRDLHKWMRDLEETMLLTLRHFGLAGYRLAPHTGAWIAERKVAAIGVKIRRWVSMHGIALNCDNDLAAFDLIVPCGIEGYGVTSLTQQLGRQVTIDEALPVVRQAFEQVFEIELPAISQPEMIANLRGLAAS